MYMALIQKVDKGRYENKQSRLSSPQFGIITIAFSDFTSDLTWGFQLLLAGGQIAAVFGALSLVAAVGVVIYSSSSTAARSRELYPPRYSHTAVLYLSHQPTAE